MFNSKLLVCQRVSHFFLTMILVLLRPPWPKRPAWWSVAWSLRRPSPGCATAVLRWGEPIRHSWSTYILYYIIIYIYIHRYISIYSTVIYIYSTVIYIYSTVIYLLSLSLNRSGFIVGPKKCYHIRKQQHAFGNLPGISQLGSSWITG